MIRIIRIIQIVLTARLDLFINKRLLPLHIRILLWPFLLFPEPRKNKAVRLRESLEKLGPIFIKFGQMLSTRKDLLDIELAKELEKLQDDVPPFNEKLAKSIIEAELKHPLSDIFASFEDKPLASASIAQIHSATLKDGKEVVIKVVRPGIEKVILKDINLLFHLARAIQYLHPDGKRLHPVEVVNDYKNTILDELDLQREAANTSQLRRNFLGSDLLYVPEVHWDYCTHKVIVMERIHGIPVTDIAALEANHINMKKLAERGVEIFFTQVFRDSFFHADMHPGNIFVSREHPENPQYIGIDCAIIGSLSESDQYYLARNLLAIFHRDYRLVAELHVECGWVPAHTKAAEFEAAIRSVCEPIFERPLGEISFGQLLIYLFQTARRFEMEVQPSLILLQKTLLNIEGLGRQLYPQLDLWTTAMPFLENWIRDRYSPKSVFQQLQRHVPGWLEQLPQIPDLVFEKLNQPASNTQTNKQKDDQQVLLLQTLKRQQRLTLLAVSGMAICTLLFFLAS